MNCLPEDLRVNDISQWLQGGWFFWKRSEEQEPEPAQITPGGEAYEVITMDGVRAPLRNRHAFPYWPACGAVNLEGFAVYVERRQVRQWRRTYNDQCVTVHVPRKWDVMKRQGADAVSINANSRALVRALFKPKYFTYSDALLMMETGQAVSVALNRQLVIAGTLVYYRNKLVAKITDQKLVPVGTDARRLGRIVKFFEGRISL